MRPRGKNALWMAALLDAAPDALVCVEPDGRIAQVNQQVGELFGYSRAELLGAEADPIHPARIYGELVPRLADDSVVIGDGGDFVSFAGKFVEPKRPGGWLDPGPYGCLGAGLGSANRRWLSASSW